VTFFENAAWRYEGKGARVAFTRPDQIPIVAGTLDGIPAHFGVDTGARSSLLLFAPFVERNGLIAKYRPIVEGITGWGIGGPVRSYVARAGMLAVGALTIARPVIRLPKQRSGLTTSTHVDGLLGPDVLKRFILYIDYSRNELIFEPAAVRLPDDSFDRFGAWMGEGDAGFRLLDVIPGSPAAEAGLHAGDEIVSIDGKPAATLDLPSVRNSLRTRPAGTRVAVAVRSGLDVLVKTVVLRDLV
jgi:membrane-associated protease RseP (regulator of RpoE activity)